MTDSSLQPMAGSPAMEDPDRLAGRLIQRAWNRDGVPEIAGGLIALFVSGIFVLQLLFEKEWRVFRALPVALVLLVPAGYLLPRAVKRVRERYLIQRAGYVEMKPLSARRRLQAVSIGLITAIIMAGAVAVAFLGHFTSATQWILAGTGVFGGVLYPLCGRAWRFVFLGVAFAATGILLGIYNFAYESGWAILYGVGGAIAVISGTVVLIRFLHQTPEARV
jgi:MFS family permease